MDRSLLEVELPRDQTAALRAPRLLEELSASAVEPDALELVSELANNPVVHGQGRIILRASLDEDRV